MRNQSHYTETFTEPQVLFSMILEKVTDLYKKYVPSFVQNRRNVSLLLVYALMLEKAKQRFGNTLRYSLGRF
ncbi:MAG TPA: hypothetical protein K8W13_08760 [Enterococcus columbae]|nr:hypothetical protein [Enterococcus columbae]